VRSSLPTPSRARSRASDNVYGFRFRGQRFDCGSKAGFLQATVAFGMARDDLRDELGEFLTDMMSVRNAAQ
jgi:UTP--glucose-1-phosphate uridylyltransferase